MDVAVRQLKNRLSEYLRLVQAGEEVVVTSRGRPIAQLVPMRPGVTESPGDLRKRLAELPWVNVGNGDEPQGASDPIRIRSDEMTLSEIVRDGRR